MVLNKILREEFGFKHILFVYSGRRGIHIWVSDKRARMLTDDQRKAIVDYLSFSRLSPKLDYSLMYSSIFRMIMGRKCAEDLLPFFLDTMIAEDGQDVLRYDSSLDVDSREDIERFQKQRFHPLLECIPSNFSCNLMLQSMMISPQ